jgi:hypothetical protein
MYPIKVAALITKPVPAPDVLPVSEGIVRMSLLRRAE